MLISKNEGVAVKSTVAKTDDDLVRQIQNKSVEHCHSEISLLYTKYKSDVIRMTRSLYPWTEEGEKDAQDLFVDAWTTALEKINEYKLGGNGTFGAWVKGVADYLKLDENRDRNRLKKSWEELTYLTLQGDEDQYSSERFGDDDEVVIVSDHGHLYKEVLVDALATLSEAERTILIEWHRTYSKNNPGSPEHAANLQTLAERFGIKPDSVRKYKLRAEQKIKNFLGLT